MSAERAAKAVGVPRSTLYRWEERTEPRSRRPQRVRQKTWSSELVRAVEALRLDYRMWGKAKLGPLLRAQGFVVSDATVGRILKSLVDRGVVVAVPTLRRRRGGKRWSAKRGFATRLPRDLKADKPGGLIQIDTLLVNIAPDKAIKHFTAYCPVAKWTVGKAFNRATAASATAFLDKVIADMLFPIEAIQGRRRLRVPRPSSKPPATAKASAPTSCRPSGRKSTALSSAQWIMALRVLRQLRAAAFGRALNPILDSFQHLYNPDRPHGALAGQSPAQYLTQRQANETPPSHRY